MDATELVYWLSGYLEDRNSLTESEIQRVKDMLATTVNIPPVKPTVDQVEKMVENLFPDLKQMELKKTIDYFRTK